MSTSPENLRQTFFESLDQTQCDTPLLHSLLQEMQQNYPTVLDPYMADAPYEAINEDMANWDERYFSKQKEYAKRNFSLQRLQHLLQVRARFREQRRQGFAPPSQSNKPLALSDAAVPYTPSDRLQKCIEEGNLVLIRNALIMELNNNRLESNMLRSALTWAQNLIPDLCEPYAEKAFSRGMSMDRTTWDKDYYMSQEVYLDLSFTQERYLHMIEVREHLRQRGVKGFAAVTSTKPAPSPQATEAPTPKDHMTFQDKNPSPTPPHMAEMYSLLKTALLIGGAIAALAMLLFTLK